MNTYFSTFDIGLSAVLLSVGFILDSYDEKDPQRVKFNFNRNEDLDKIIQGYWTKELRIEPQTLLSNLKLLKNRIHSNDTRN